MKSKCGLFKIKSYSYFTTNQQQQQQLKKNNNNNKIYLVIPSNVGLFFCLLLHLFIQLENFL